MPLHLNVNSAGNPAAQCRVSTPETSTTPHAEVSPSRRACHLVYKAPIQFRVSPGRLSATDEAAPHIRSRQRTDHRFTVDTAIGGITPSVSDSIKAGEFGVEGKPRTRFSSDPCSRHLVQAHYPVIFDIFSELPESISFVLNRNPPSTSRVNFIR